MSLTVLCITGFPGSGKSVFAEVAESHRGITVVMGDVIRDYVKKQGNEPSSENARIAMRELREERGEAAIAELCIEEIERLHSRGKKLIVIDGIRSIAELEAFKVAFPGLSLIAVHASQRDRFNRLQRRGRTDAPPSWEDFLEREELEESLGVGLLVSVGDHHIDNSESLADMRSKSEYVLKVLEIIF